MKVGEKFFSKETFHGGEKHRNKVEIKKQKKTNLTQKVGGEEIQEEYPTSVPTICIYSVASVCNRCTP